MAALGGLEALVGSLPADTKRVMTEVLRALVPFLRFGPVETQTKAENFAGYSIISTTAAASTTEFTVAHGMGRAPYRAMPILDLNSSGMELVSLRVTRPADASRMYFTSPSTGAVFTLYVE